MKYFVMLHDREFEVELGVAQSGSWTARIGDREYRVDLCEVEALRHYSVLLDRQSFDVVVDGPNGQLQLQMAGHRLGATVEDERERAARVIEGGRGAGPETILSMMPGVIRGVRVQPGDAVAAGTPLVILEAMKMENEIRAEHPGVVKEVLVEVGSAVESGAPLVLMEPPEDAEPEAAAGARS